MAETKPAPKGAESRNAERYQISPLAVLSRLLKDYFLAIAGAAAVALLLRVFVVEAFRIPTDFMSPQLLPGDHIFVNKLAYGKLGGKPERGDIIVFNFTNDPTKDYIKRIVAIEGDTVEIRDSQVWLNGKAASRPMEPDVFDESLGDHHYYVQWKGALAEARKMTLVKVPPGQIFVLGDNRAKGQDSRAYGFLPVGNIQGRASLIWFSAGTARDSGLLGVRWSRLLTRVN